jgi:hypothetical protein|nr:MAG TPA: Cell wall hydrolase autolysin [Bacteriophage sp.]
MATYNVHAGHCPQDQGAYGAVGVLQESVEDRIVKNAVIAKLEALGHTVYDCTCDENTSQNGCLAAIVAKCNSHNVDLDISIHLNSGRDDYEGDDSTGGTEVYGYDTGTEEIGSKICEAISEKLNIRNRGFKINQGLYVLRSTHSPAILIECCFVDDRDDANRWNAEACAEAIVKALTGENVSNEVEDNSDDNSDNSEEYIPSRSNDLGHVDVYYQAKTDRWWDEVHDTNDWAGAGDDKPITAIALRVSEGDVRYQVHLLNGGWLPEVDGYDINDDENGYAGNARTAIDAIKAVYYTPEGYEYQCLYTQVSPQGMTGFYPVQIDDQTVNGQDGYAGCFGKYIDKVQFHVE